MSKFLDLSGLKLVLMSVMDKYDKVVADIRNSLVKNDESTTAAMTKATSAYDLALTVKTTSEKAITDSEKAKLNSESALTNSENALTYSGVALDNSNKAITNSNTALEQSSESSATADEALTKSKQAVSDSALAKRNSSQAVEDSTTALIQSTIAINTVSTLEGLNNANTSAKVLAEKVSQIEANAYDIEILKNSVVYLTKDEWDELIENNLVEEGVEYNIYT